MSLTERSLSNFRLICPLVIRLKLPLDCHLRAPKNVSVWLLSKIHSYCPCVTWTSKKEVTDQLIRRKCRIKGTFKLLWPASAPSSFCKSAWKKACRRSHSLVWMYNSAQSQIPSILPQRRCRGPKFRLKVRSPAPCGRKHMMRICKTILTLTSIVSHGAACLPACI